MRKNNANVDMPKVIKYLLIGVVLVGLIFAFVYFYQLMAANKRIGEAIDRAEEIDIEIVKEVIKDRSSMIYVYYPKESPDAQNIKDLAAYLSRDRASSSDYLSIWVFDNKDSAEYLAQDMLNIDVTENQEEKKRMESAFNGLIVEWDTMNYKTVAGKNYKYLDGLDVRL